MCVSSYYFTEKCFAKGSIVEIISKLTCFICVSKGEKQILLFEELKVIADSYSVT